MQGTPIVDELTGRIQSDLEYFNGEMPERTAIAWCGYLAGLLEWSVIDVAAHDRLLALLPAIADDPVTDILLGRE